MDSSNVLENKYQTLIYYDAFCYAISINQDNHTTTCSDVSIPLMTDVKSNNEKYITHTHEIWELTKINENRNRE